MISEFGNIGLSKEKKISTALANWRIHHISTVHTCTTPLELPLASQKLKDFNDTCHDPLPGSSTVLQAIASWAVS
jgi:hypothetical protein